MRLRRLEWRGRELDGEDRAAVGVVAGRDAAGEHQAALARSEEVYERSVRSRGIDHPYTLGCAVNLVLDLRTTGEQERARGLWEETLVRLERVLGLGHPEVVAAITGQRADHDIEPPPL